MEKRLKGTIRKEINALANEINPSRPQKAKVAKLGKLFKEYIGTKIEFEFFADTYMTGVINGMSYGNTGKTTELPCITVVYDGKAKKAQTIPFLWYFRDYIGTLDGWGNLSGNPLFRIWFRNLKVI